MSKKATLESLETLHDSVAKTLKANLDDPKVLAQAITFLKNNNITVDLQESKPMQDVFTTIKALTSKPMTENTPRDDIDSLLEELA